MVLKGRGQSTKSFLGGGILPRTAPHSLHMCNTGELRERTPPGMGAPICHSMYEVFDLLVP